MYGEIYTESIFLKKIKSFLQISHMNKDKLFNMQCCLSGARYAFLDDIGKILRRNEQSISYQYNPKQSQCWITIAKQIRDYAKKNKTNTENKNIKNAATGLMEYILFFGIFFAAKMEYTDGSGINKESKSAC